MEKGLISIVVLLILLVPFSSTTVHTPTYPAYHEQSDHDLRYSDDSTISNGDIVLEDALPSNENDDDREMMCEDLNISQVTSLMSIKNFLGLSDEHLDLIERNCFAGVIDDVFEYDDFAKAYDDLKKNRIPIFVTTDSMLHTYHIFFDDLLRSVEEEYFIGYSENMTIAMLEKVLEQYNNVTSELKDIARKNVAFFSVALRLIAPNATIPTFVEGLVSAELELIAGHEGFKESPIFNSNPPPPPELGYMEDYSQYKPRGHYTRSEALKRYFKEMMWYGRMMFRGAVDGELIQSLLISDAMKTAEHIEPASYYWERIYEVTSFFVGLSDDLSYQEYLPAIQEVYGTLSLDYIELLDVEKLEEFRNKTKTMNNPRISSSFVTDQQDMVNATKGLRFMGQRFIPDSYMFQQLVYGFVTNYLGSGDPFTKICADFSKCVRGFPRGLDIMAVLGSEKAEEILEVEGDTEYEDYEKQYSKLKNEFSNVTVDEWNQNLYWSWLYGLKTLNSNFTGSDYPDFMETEAWEAEKLNTNLGSWSELRHDTILYAKQSYTQIITISIPLPPQYDEKGYVEPVPEFYQRLVDLTNDTINGLSDFSVLSGENSYKLNALMVLLKDLKAISEKELAGEELAENEYEQIREIGGILAAVIGDVDSEGKETTMVADVHTDPNTRQVLEEGVGYLDFAVIVVELTDGTLASMAGPIFSYYEFKQPMDDRLTDEQWKEMLQTNTEPPRPSWMSLYAA